MVRGDDRKCFVLVIKELGLGLEFTGRVKMLRQPFVGWRNWVKLCNHLFHATTIWRARAIRNPVL